MSIKNILQNNNLNIITNESHINSITATNAISTNLVTSNNIEAVDYISCEKIIVREINGPDSIIRLDKLLIPTQDNVLDIGTNDKKINSIYVSNLNGANNTAVNFPTGIAFQDVGPIPSQQELNLYQNFTGLLLVSGFDIIKTAPYNAFKIGNIVQLNFACPIGTITNIGPGDFLVLNSLPSEITPNNDEIMFTYPAQLDTNIYGICTGIITPNTEIHLFGGIELNTPFNINAVAGPVSSTINISVSYIV